MNKRDGLTLIEVLIASAILLIILGLITTGLQTSGNVVGTITSQSELIEETRFAGQIISDELSRAVYVFRDGMTLTLANSYNTRNPSTNTNSWTVRDATNTNAAPILAFLQAPQTIGQPCVLPNQTTGCLTFFAYYPVQRSVVMSQAPAADRPRQSNNDANTWVIYEYKQPLAFNRLTSNATDSLALTSIPTTFTTGQASIIADFIQPNTGFVTNLQTCSDSNPTTSGSRLVNCRDLSANTDYWRSVRSGVLTVQATMQQQGKTISTPLMTFPIAPRNATPTQQD
jgi:prepilin-type N-terminal cleavage/methylation domain-containing protein